MVCKFLFKNLLCPRLRTKKISILKVVGIKNGNVWGDNMISKDVKEIAFNLGAELCGIASIDRFDDAPEGSHPLDILPTCKSVISFVCRFPAGTLACKSAVPYTRVRNSITPKMDAIALNLTIELEKRGVLAIPIPTNESLMDTKTQRWRSIISQRHLEKS